MHFEFVISVKFRDIQTMRYFVWLSILFFVTNPIFGQYQFPDDGIVFSDAEVPRVDIFIDSDSLAAILDEDNLSSNYEYPATFIFTNSNGEEMVENVGFRLRGNTSRGAHKKSFKISFNTFESGQKFHGLEKMNLNGEHNDPSIMRSKLGWDMVRWAGLPGSRTNHVELYINTQYRGLYLNVEHIDEEFVDKRMSDGNGNLYKCLWPADLHYKGEDPNLYAEYENWGRQAYALKTNVAAYDYSDLAHFIDVLNNYTGTTFRCELERVFDVENYLKMIAVDILMSNWDGPIINKNNFYLYNNPCTNQFTYLPYDLDNTFGIDWWGIDWVDSDIYQWSELSEDYRPIYEKLMAVPEYKDRFTFYMEEMLEQFFNNTFMANYLNEKLALLSPYRMNDEFAEGDYGWNFGDFEDSFETGLGEHVHFGLKNYIELRRASIVEQLENVDAIPVVQNIDVDWSENQVVLDIQTIDDHALTFMFFHYQLDGGDWQTDTLPINVSGMTTHIFETDEVALMTYYFEIFDNVGQSRAYPLCQDATIQLGYLPTHNVVINEIMASNESTVTDEFNEHDDWIEIYNAGNVVAPIHQYFLSDDPTDPMKWQLPNTILNPGQYIVIWADNDPEQGAYHTNFKLKQEGEFLGLYDAKSNHNAIVDQINFPPQETDKGYARIPNGTGDFVILDYATPYANNETPLHISENTTSKIRISPNPANDIISIKTDNHDSFDLICYDVNGVERLRVYNAEILDVSELVGGVYFLEVVRDGEVLGLERVVVY